MSLQCPNCKRLYAPSEAEEFKGKCIFCKKDLTEDIVIVNTQKVQTYTTEKIDV